uniref:Uncharacterized protein n=1 Tax=Noccaea caerulescens TaxID=107243 RepID=A0A1J3JKZ4_NOCCA
MSEELRFRCDHNQGKTMVLKAVTKARLGFDPLEVNESRGHGSVCNEKATADIDDAIDNSKQLRIFLVYPAVLARCCD